MRLKRFVPPTRNEYRQVLANLKIPPSLGKRPRVEGSVWAVTMVRNEEDTIGRTVRHLFRQGVDGVIVADNLSTDGTARVLRELAEGLPVHVAHDGLVAYYQGTKMTVLADMARRSGADWIVPFDADELWFARDALLADWLRTSDVPVVGARIHNVFPALTDDAADQNPFSRLRLMDLSPSPYTKVAFRAIPGATIEMGNHGVLRRGPYGDHALRIAHFPWRSLEQLKDKVVAGSRAVLAVGDLQSVSVEHWRTLAANDAELAEVAWASLCRGQAITGSGWLPVGRLVEMPVWTWPTWRLEV